MSRSRCEHDPGDQKSCCRSRDRDRPPVSCDLDDDDLAVPLVPPVDVVEKIEKRNVFVCHSTEHVS